MFTGIIVMPVLLCGHICGQIETIDSHLNNIPNRNLMIAGAIPKDFVVFGIILGFGDGPENERE